MLKHYAKSAVIYAVLAMIGGVFYREYTKFNHFTGKTNLSVVHTHYFLLGMVFFLLLMLLEKNFSFSSGKNISKKILSYHIGINITTVGFLMRGLIQVWGMALSKGMDASISGISGIGHIFTGISMVMILLQIKKQVDSMTVSHS